MLGARILLCLACLVATINSCLIPDAKGNQEVHVFHIGSPESKSGNDPDIIELHIPDARRKRGASKNDDTKYSSCKKDGDCPANAKCSLKTSKCQSSPPPSPTTFHREDLGGGTYEYYVSGN